MKLLFCLFSCLFIRNYCFAFVIDGILDLKGGEISLPQKEDVIFTGGLIKNGTVIFNDNKIINPKFENVRFKGSVENDYFNIVDYGAISDRQNDCSMVLNDLINLKSSSLPSRSAKTIHIPNGTFYLKNSINLWAGWESPITLEGNGNTSTLCQLKDNEYILKMYECHYIKNLKLTYDKRQGISNTRSVAVACQRAIYSLFENLTICKSNSAFGYIKLKDQKQGFNPTGYKDQCYVSCNFRNIRIYETSGYAFDFKKEFAQGDSGSAFDNVYISCNDWACSTRDNVQTGAIRGDNTVACYTQLNIEGENHMGALIELNGMSRVSVESLHLEGIKNMPSIAKIQVQSVASFNIIDVQRCEFSSSQYNLFEIRDSGLANVKLLTLRQDCRKTSSELKPVLSSNLQRLKIEQTLDAIMLF